MIKLTIQSIPPVAKLETEAGSIAEAVAIFSENGSKVLGEFFQQVIAAAVGAQTSTRQLTIPAPTSLASPVEPNLAAEVEGGVADTVEEQGADGKPTRRRRTKAEMAAARAADAVHNGATLAAAKANVTALPVAPAPVVAVAPAPMPIPGIVSPAFVTAAPPAVPAVATATATAGSVESGIPAVFQRTAPPPPPPMVLPSPPVCNLGRKVSEHLKARGESPELLQWLLTSAVGLIQPEAKWTEATDVLLFITDDKIRPIAGALGVV